MKKWIIILATGLLLAGLGYVGAVQWQLGQLADARAAFDDAQFGQARLLSNRLQWLPLTDHIKQSSAFTLANAYLNDAELEGETAFEKAIPLLESIRPDDEDFCSAIVLRAKQKFLVEYQPCAAEELLQQALAKEPTHLKANELLFAIYAATNRADQAHDVFWTFFDQAPEIEQPYLFRLWFLSQFTRNAANRELDIAFGVVSPNAEPGELDPLMRFLLFKEREPNRSLHYGALASHWLWKTESETALQTLEAGQRQSDDLENQVYLTSLIQALINQGEFQRAEQYLEAWPIEDRAFGYWRDLAVLQEAAGRFEEAVDSFRKAETFWPGAIDSNGSYRLSQCLRKLGREEEALRQDQQTALIRLWLEDNWSKIRRALDFLGDETAARDLLEFFQAIKHPQATAYLERHLERLKTTLKTEPDNPAPQSP